jgi:hypothetical protein
MFAKFKTVAIAALVALGAFSAMPASAQASGFSFSGGNGSVTVQFGSGGYHHRPYHHGARRAACTERQAAFKAADMGLRNVRVVDSDRRSIEVRGRSHRHGRTTVIFARAPHCPVIARY